MVLKSLWRYLTAGVGSRRRPAVVRVHAPERAQVLIALCQERGIHCIAAVEPGQPEDVSDVERALGVALMIHSEHKVGRNAPCPCGSGKKWKKCCGSPSATVGV